MPIKFRCSYCRQFLGISRSQAGGVVDCPTCGRSIRVPKLDGTVQPISDPELKLEDQHLVKALDELARLADAPIQRFVSLTSTQEESDENESDAQVPQPLLEPIPIEVPLPPTPVIVQTPVNAALATSRETGIASQESLFAELATLSAGTSHAGSSSPTSVTERPTKRGALVELTAWFLSIVVLAIFVAGMLTERFVKVLEGVRRTDAPVNEKSQLPTADNELTGRITYKTKAGESQPDRGARILIFPQQRQGEVKLSVVGFRPADSPADQLVANAAMKALGGAAASVSESGRFQLQIEAGSYRILVLSHFQPRDDAVNDPTLDKLLSEYFDNPNELLGRVRYQFSSLRIKGTGDVWDHSF